MMYRVGMGDVSIHLMCPFLTPIAESNIYLDHGTFRQPVSRLDRDQRQREIIERLGSP
jgi:hypothetical protein